MTFEAQCSLLFIRWNAKFLSPKIAPGHFWTTKSPVQTQSAAIQPGTSVTQSRLTAPSQNIVVVKAGGQQGEGEGAELDAIPTVEFILKLHPENKRKKKKNVNKRWGRVRQQLLTCEGLESWVACQSYQWRRRAWRKADRPSITMRMDTVSTAKKPNMGTRNKTPTRVFIRRPMCITIVQSTSDSSVRAERVARAPRAHQHTMMPFTALRVQKLYIQQHLKTSKKWKCEKQIKCRLTRHIRM